MNGTAILYLAIFLVTTILGSLSQYVRKADCVSVEKIFFFLSFFIHWIFLAFTRIGADYNNYVRIIKLVSLDNITSDSEIVFNGLCLVLKTIFESPDIVIFLIKTITLLLFYFAFIQLAHEVNLGLCLLAFNAFVYLQGFFILGMQLSIACLFTSVVYLKHDCMKRALLFLVVACGTHSSSLLFIPVFIAYFIVNARKQKMSKSLKALMILSYLSVYLLLEDILTWVVNHITPFAQYKIYNMVSDYSGTGLMQIAFFIPLIYYVYLININSNSVNLKNLATIFVATAFLFAMIGYKIEVFSRINKSFLMIYSYLIPCFFFERKHNKHQFFERERKYIFNYRSDLAIWVGYLLIRGLDVFIDLGLKSSTSLLNPFIWYNPFS